MSTRVAELEESVKKLSHDEFLEFQRWFEGFEAAKWDEELERDAVNGKLDQMAAEARQHYLAGRFSEYPEPKV